MKPYAAAAVLWGVACGAFVYRFAMLPLDWSPGWKHVLEAAAICLAVVTYQIVRHPDDTVKRSTLRYLFAIGTVAALIAFGAAYVAFPAPTRAAEDEPVSHAYR